MQDRRKATARLRNAVGCEAMVSIQNEFKARVKEKTLAWFLSSVNADVEGGPVQPCPLGSAPHKDSRLAATMWILWGEQRPAAQGAAHWGNLTSQNILMKYL